MPTVPHPGSPTLVRSCPFGTPDAYTRLRDSGETGQLELPNGQTGHLLTSYADVTAMLSDPRFCSSVNAAPPLTDDGGSPGWFFGLDGTEHASYRGLLTGRFTMRAIRRIEPRVTAIASRLIEGMRSRGDSADLLADFARPLPGLVMCDLLGIDPQSQEEFDRQLAVLDDPALPGTEKLATFRAVWSSMRDTARCKREAPDDDVISYLMTGEAPDDEPRATPEAAASMIFSLRLGGQAPVTHALAMGTFLLLREGLHLRQLQSPKELDLTVDELLRYVPSNNLGVVRVATEDATLGGHPVRSGDLVFAALPVANRDPAQFDDPETFDMARTTGTHLAFGHGTHRCLGHNLARVEIGVALRTLFQRLPELRLAVPAAEVRMVESGTTYSVAELPVTW